MWRLLLFVAPAVVFPICRLRVSGGVPAGLREGPLILAANHVSPVDPIVMTAACRKARLAPRFMATGGIFKAPVVGAMMRRSGHIRVDRRSAHVAQALPDAAAALKANSVVLVYPEGRIGLDPWMWPERGKTGVARMTLESAVPVIPVAMIGTDKVNPIGSRMWRPRKVHIKIGEPLDSAALIAATRASSTESKKVS